MVLVVKWLDRAGRLGQSDRHPSPSEALRFSRSLAALQPRSIWAETDDGGRFQITLGVVDNSLE